MSRLRRADRRNGQLRNTPAQRVQENQPLAKRFHRHPNDGCGRLRYWEVAVWNNLHSRLPGRRFCANLLADALYIIYRSRKVADVHEEFDWLMANTPADDIQGFIGLTEIFDIEPEDVRGAVLRDISAGRTRTMVAV